jgi:hypothetical protein
VLRHSRVHLCRPFALEFAANHLSGCVRESNAQSLQQTAAESALLCLIVTRCNIDKRATQSMFSLVSTFNFCVILPTIFYLLRFYLWQGSRGLGAYQWECLLFANDNVTLTQFVSNLTLDLGRFSSSTFWSWVVGCLRYYLTTAFFFCSRQNKISIRPHFNYANRSK